jgi:hypothetical protein
MRSSRFPGEHRAFLAIVIALLLLAASCAKIGGHSSSGASSTAPGSSVITPSPPSPKITITAPKRASFLDNPHVTVQGKVTDPTAPIRTFQINGQPVSLAADGSFSHPLLLEEGLNVISAKAVNDAGVQGMAAISVIHGQFVPLSTPLKDSLRVRINKAAWEQLAEAGHMFFRSVNLNDWFKTINPIYHGSVGSFTTARIHIKNASYGNSSARVVSITSSGIPVEGKIHDISTTMEIDKLLSLPITISAVCRADMVKVTSLATAGVDAQGKFHVDFSQTKVEFTNFSFRFTNFTSFIEPILKPIVRNALENLIEDAIDNEATKAIEKALGWWNTPFNINFAGLSIPLSFRATSMTFDPAGTTLLFETDPSSFVPGGASRGPGSLATNGVLPVPGSHSGFSISMNDDAVNKICYAAWEANSLKLTLDSTFFKLVNPSSPNPFSMKASTLITILPELGPHLDPSDPVIIRLDPQLPPVFRVSGNPELIELGLGELKADFAVLPPGGKEQLVLTVIAHVKAWATPSIQNNCFSCTSSTTPEVAFEVVAEPLLDLSDAKIETLLRVLLVPSLPYLINLAKNIQFPGYPYLTIKNASIYADGPSLDHLTVSGDLGK